MVVSFAAEVIERRFVFGASVDNTSVRGGSETDGRDHEIVNVIFSGYPISEYESDLL
jgi:hypothetical protein